MIWRKWYWGASFCNAAAVFSVFAGAWHFDFLWLSLVLFIAGVGCTIKSKIEYMRAGYGHG